MTLVLLPLQRTLSILCELDREKSLFYEELLNKVIIAELKLVLRLSLFVVQFLFFLM